MKQLMMAAIIGGVIVGTASAEAIVRREKTQQARIYNGVASGELTRKEALKLEQKEARLRCEIRADRVDGRGLTPQERREIDYKQDKLSREIYKETHDNQRRY